MILKTIRKKNSGSLRIFPNVYQTKPLTHMQKYRIHPSSRSHLFQKLRGLSPIPQMSLYSLFCTPPNKKSITTTTDLASQGRVKWPRGFLLKGSPPVPGEKHSMSHVVNQGNSCCHAPFHEVASSMGNQVFESGQKSNRKRHFFFFFV